MEEEKYGQLMGIEKLIWYGKFDEAEEILQSFYRKKHPSFDLLLCEDLAIKSLISEDKKDFKTAVKYIKETIENSNLFLHRQHPALRQFYHKIEGKNEKNEKRIVIDDLDPSVSLSNAFWAIAINAELQLMISVIRFRQEKYVKGGFHFRRSWKLYEEGEELARKIEREEEKVLNFYEIKGMIDLGIGLFNFLCSSMPPPFLFLIENIGFKADREVALKALTRTMNTPSSLRSNIATAGLGWIYSSIYFDYEKAMEISFISLSRYPDNGFCLYMMGNIMRREGLLEEAVSKFNTIFHVMPYAMGLQMKMKYEMGNTYYLMGDWNNALPLLEFYVTHSLSPSFKAIGIFQTAYCHHMMDDDEKMAEYLKRVHPNVRKNFPYDEYAGKLAKKYSSGKLNEFELQFHYCFLLLECSHYTKILSLCDKLQQNETNLLDQVRVYTLRGVSLLNLKDLKGAKEYFQLVVANEAKVKKEKFVLAYSYEGLANIALQQNQHELACSFIKKAKGISKYDLEENFVWKIRRTEEMIHHAKEKK